MIHRSRYIKCKLVSCATSIIQALLDEHLSGDQALYQQRHGAAKLAQRRKLGPYSQRDIDPKERQRQLGILARRGFPFSLAQSVLNATLEELEEWSSSD